MQQIVKKTYFLVAYRNHAWIHSNISIDDKSEDTGFIHSNLTHIKWDVLIETKDFDRELKVGESIHIEGKDYSITNVSHTIDGNIIYYINKSVVEEDEESMKKAESDLQARKQILLERAKARLEKVETKLEECERKIKKWYQFWKV